MQKPPIVLDNGTGYSKLGFAGNFEPSFIIPSMIATADDTKTNSRMRGKNLEHDLNFFVGDEAAVKRPNYNVNYPIRKGQIDNWDHMEKLWQRCIYQYLQCDPEEHYMLLTEPPMNTPENREYTAEIMFETFNVPGLYIAVQAVLALHASLLAGGDTSDSRGPSMTGTVIDSGDGVTHIIPVVEGYVIASCIKDMPLAGRVVTDFILQQLRDRGEKLPADDALGVAKKIKEMYCYVCPNLINEYAKYDSEQLALATAGGDDDADDNSKGRKKKQKRFKQYTDIDSRTGKPFTIDVGYERFLGPELFFSPEIFSSDWTTPLSDMVDQTIQACPIDARRPLYNYITLSGGTTMFKYFSERLKRDVKSKVSARHEKRKALYPNLSLTPTEVNVIHHEFQRFAVWFGGSILAAQPEFTTYFHTKAQYDEEGPRIARHSPVFSM